MVSIGTYLSVGALAAAVIAFYKLGGAKGIGSRVGTGLTDFTLGLLNPFDDNKNKTTEDCGWFGEKCEKPPTQGPTAPPTQGPTNSPPQDERVSPTKDCGWFGEKCWTDPPVSIIIDPMIPTPAPTIPDNFMDQFTFEERPTSRPTTPAITYGPLPPFAGTLEYVVEKEFEGPKLPAYAGTLDYVYGNNV